MKIFIKSIKSPSPIGKVLGGILHLRREDAITDDHSFPNETIVSSWPPTAPLTTFKLECHSVELIPNSLIKSNQVALNCTHRCQCPEYGLWIKVNPWIIPWEISDNVNNTETSFSKLMILFQSVHPEWDDLRPEWHQWRQQVRPQLEL